MDLMEAIRQRHSVRKYEDRPIEPEVVEKLEQAIDVINKASGLSILFVTDAPDACDTLLAKVMKIQGVNNYFAMIGKKSPDLDEKVGYYGERLVLLAQQLGLNTCWMGGTYSKGKTAVELEDDESLVLIITVGYGKTQGKPHKGKSMTDVSGESDVSRSVPMWYKNGVNAALMAPTAINQQKFAFSRDGNKVKVTAGIGAFAKVDLGIVKCHFEIGAGVENFEWVE